MQVRDLPRRVSPPLPGGFLPALCARRPATLLRPLHTRVCVLSLAVQCMRFVSRPPSGHRWETLSLFIETGGWAAVSAGAVHLGCFLKASPEVLHAPYAVG